MTVLPHPELLSGPNGKLATNRFTLVGEPVRPRPGRSLATEIFEEKTGKAVRKSEEDVAHVVGTTDLYDRSGELRLIPVSEPLTPPRIIEGKFWLTESLRCQHQTLRV